MSTVIANRQTMTANEFWDFCQRPENAERSFELIRGEMVEMSRPNLVHAILCSNIAFLLQLWLRQHRVGFVAVDDGGLVLHRNPDLIGGPDVAYYSHFNRYEDVPPHWSETPPVLAVEVQSPTERRDQIHRKILAYLQHGVRVVWQVDAEEQTITVHRPQRNYEAYGVNDVIGGGDELPGFSAPVRELFTLPGDAAP